MRVLHSTMKNYTSMTVGAHFVAEISLTSGRSAT